MSKKRMPRKQLSADALYRELRQSFQQVADPRVGGVTISVGDALMSGFAMFAMKDPSMLAFDQRRQIDKKNLQMIFHLENVPCDTRMRELLDPLDPEQLRPAFRHLFTPLMRGKVLEQFRFLDRYELPILAVPRPNSRRIAARRAGRATPIVGMQCCPAKPRPSRLSAIPVPGIAGVVSSNSDCSSWSSAKAAGTDTDRKP